jgi:tetratricopeptide (TPR) repeat protein
MTSADQKNPLIRVLELLKSADNHARWNEYDEAERLCRDAIDIAKGELGENHHAHATALRDLGNILTKQERGFEAREALTKALEILVKIHGNNDAEVLQLFAHVHDLYR